MLSVIIMQNKKVQYKMENNELKNICIKNLSHHYFDDRIKLEDFDLDNILIDEKWHENILIYDISYKTLTGSKPLGIRFDKIDRIIRIYDGTRYITLLGTKKYGAVYDRIRFRISLKSNITYVFCQYFAQIKVDSYDSYYFCLYQKPWLCIMFYYSLIKIKIATPMRYS